MSIFSKSKLYFQKKSPFVLFSKPNSTVLKAYFQKNDDLIDFQNQEGFVFQTFYRNENLIIPENNSLYFEENLSLTIQNEIGNDIIINEDDKEFFVNLVQRGIDSINSNEFQKVVLSRKIEIDNNFDVFESFENLLIEYPTAFRYLFYHPKVGMWMGATPELLLKIQKNILSTVALAGTQVFTDKIEWQNKEIDEQKLVVDYISSQLENYSEKLKISDTYNQKAGNLIHLKSDIQAELKSNSDLLTVVNALHPTSAVCGMPLFPSRKFILENESYDRKFYSGFLGEWKQDNNSELFVNLRCCEITTDKINIYVGCGITKDSIPEKEYIETINKSKTISSILVKK